MMTITRAHLTEVEGIGPDVDEAVEGDEDEQKDQDGHNYLILIGVHYTPGSRQLGVDQLLAAVAGHVRFLHKEKSSEQ